MGPRQVFLTPGATVSEMAQRGCSRSTLIHLGSHVWRVWSWIPSGLFHKSRYRFWSHFFPTSYQTSTWPPATCPELRIYHLRCSVPSVRLVFKGTRQERSDLYFFFLLCPFSCAPRRSFPLGLRVSGSHLTLSLRPASAKSVRDPWINTTKGIPKSHFTTHVGWCRS
jgi:hypothetical protein